MSRTTAIVYNIYFVLCLCRLFSVWCATGAPAWPGLGIQLAVAAPEKPATGLLPRGNVFGFCSQGRQIIRRKISAKLLRAARAACKVHGTAAAVVQVAMPVRL